MSTSWFADYALLPDGLARDVEFVVQDGRFVGVRTGATDSRATRLPGIVLPGLANCHSHAFHRALRGRTHDQGGTFWTWRERMYELARVLDPDSYHRLARGVFAEMVLAGYTSVGEFHYLHHQPSGRPYGDPNAMGEAVVAAADEAGIRLTLLDTCYLAGGLTEAGHLPLDPVQRRFADTDVDAWAQRVAALSTGDRARIGAAIHSVRAVPRAALPTVVAASSTNPLHVHLSEQPAENAACVAYYGCTPTQLLAEAGALAERTTAVHATHLTAEDINMLGAKRVTACFCPTTERDLADGIGPAAELRAAGVNLSIGSDQHAVVDAFEEVRAVELNERLVSLRRGGLSPGDLLIAATAHGTLGWPDAGRLEVGARADLVAVRLDSVRTAGIDPAQVLFAATAADVDTVVIDGVPVVSSGAHRIGAVGPLLADAIGALT